LASFRFDTSKFKSAKHLDDKIRRALFGVCRYWDGPVERYAKVNAPWTDRTGNARAELAAEAQKLARNRFGIVLSHGVDYGIYLEKSNDENYAIIMPTIRVMAPKVMAFCTKLMDRLDRQVGGA
jgi:hypothetical protein